MHQPRAPMLSVVSYGGSALYNLNKYITGILKAYVKDEYENAENSTTFSNYIRNVAIEDNEIIVSFGVQFYN